jgi:hypothetical protein
MVSAGQLITARFAVSSDAAPIYWAIGVGALADTTASGSWDWVVDEDGAYGVTKSTMKAACPTPGIQLGSWAAGPNIVSAPFVVPDYGPSPVTMALHVRVVQGPLSYCNGNELYKVFVVNPAATPSMTSTASRTPTVGPTQTATPTPTVGTFNTSTPTPVQTTAPTMVPTSAPVAAKPVVRIAVPVPNPGPSSIRFYVEGVADVVKVDFYTYAYTLVASETRSSVGGWSWVPMPALGRGGFIAKVTAYASGVQTSFKTTFIYCL